MSQKREDKKAMQRALMQFTYPQNYDLVHKALTIVKRTDLIGNGPNCLISQQNQALITMAKKERTK